MTKEEITQIANKLVKEDGLINLSLSKLCDHAEIPKGSFQRIMGCTFTRFMTTLYNVVESDEVREVNKTRTDPKLRKNQILNVAVNLAKKNGYHKITRDDVAKNAGVSASLISKYFNTMKQLRRAIVRAAIQREIPEIVAQGIANRDEHVKKASEKLKRQALDLIANY